MKKVDFQTYYKKRASNYDIEANWIARDAELLNLHRIAAGNNEFETVLDIATGTGIVGSLFKQMSDNVIGIDISASMLNQARKRIESLILCSGEELPFESDSISLLLCRQGLHYMNPLKALKEFHRVCNRRIMVSQITCYGKTDSKWWWGCFGNLVP